MLRSCHRRGSPWSATDPAPMVAGPPVPPPPTPPKPTETPKSAKRIPRTWPQRLTVAAVFVMAIGSFGAAGALYAGQRVIEDRNIAPAIIDPSQATTVVPADPSSDAGEESADSVAPPETFPAVEPDAKNFLITGADNNSCIDPDSPYAPAFGDRSNLAVKVVKGEEDIFGRQGLTRKLARAQPAAAGNQ